MSLKNDQGGDNSDACYRKVEERTVGSICCGGGAKSKMTMNLEFGVGRLLEPLAEVEVGQGSCFVRMEGLRLNFQ